MGFFKLALLLTLTISTGLVKGLPPTVVFDEDRASNGIALQDVVTYGADSGFVRGERVFLHSGEYRIFRLPVPEFWIDNFQKIEALKFTAVSFYLYWPLLEGKRGAFSAEGVGAGTHGTT